MYFLIVNNLTASFLKVEPAGKVGLYNLQCAWIFLKQLIAGTISND